MPSSVDFEKTLVNSVIVEKAIGNLLANQPDWGAKEGGPLAYGRSL
jgi:hypothetical protein